MVLAALPALRASPVVIADPNLDVIVRTALAKPTGSLTSTDMLALVSLSGYSRNITNLSGLEWAFNLQSLYLSGNAIRDLTPLQGLGGLVSLALDRNQIGNPAPLAGLTNLSFLALGGNPIGDYSSVFGLTNLTSLSLNSGAITTLAGWTNLNHLASLSVSSNNIADLSPLVQLPNLKYLDLRLNAITNGAVLSALTNLASLFAGNNAISNLNFLQPLTRLTFLNLDSDGVSDLSPLAGLTNLNYMVLSGNPGITNFSVLSGLTGLKNLELRGNTISNLAFVSTLNRLSFADLAFNSITNLSPLILLTNLTAVNLSGNPNTNYPVGLPLPANVWLFNESISNVAFLTNSPQLTALGLDGNLVTDPSPLKALTNLTYLGLSRNPITNYAALAGFTNLTGLWLESVAASNLNFAPGLTSLRNLSLRTNRLNNLTALAGLTNLSTVYAANNRLTNIAALTNLLNLSRVEVSENLLDLSPGSAAATVIQSLQSRGVQVDYLPTNQPPTVAIPPNWYIAANQTSSLSFFASDALVTPGELTLTASSSNPGLVTNASITFSGTNTAGLITVTPITNQTGTTTITLKVSQPPGGLSVSTNILVTVLYSTNLVLDPNLAGVVSGILGKTGTNLTTVDLFQLTGIYAAGANISSLSGLESAPNLTALYLDGNGITNVAPLRNLTGLVSLGLNNNLIPDVSPLAGLTNLTYLGLGGNPVTNLAALSGLTNLATLYVYSDSLTNLNFLKNFRQLSDLDASFNLLTDLSPLSGLTNLATLILAQNRLTNVGPLASLPLLSYVDLSLNLLDYSAIGGLLSNGVAVNFDPQRTPPIIDVRTNWVAPVNTNSSLTFNVWDTGPPGETLGVAAMASNADLTVSAIPGTNQTGVLFWTLAVTNQITTNASRWLTLTATNDVGLTSSALVLVQLTALSPVTGSWLGNTNLTWTGSSGAPWFGQGIVTHNGAPAAQSSAIGNSRVSRLQTTVQGPGKLVFWWKVSSQTNADYLQFSVADYTNAVSGEADWQQQIVNVPAGLQTLAWRYIKDADTSSGSDAGWVSQVTYTPGIWLEILGGVTNAQCNLLLHAVPATAYEIMVSTDLLNWSSQATVVPTNTAMPYLDTNAVTSACFYRLYTLPASSIWLDSSGLANGLFCFALHSPPNLPMSIQAANAFTNWTTLGYLTNTSGLLWYTDLQSAGFPVRYYRAVISP